MSNHIDTLKKPKSILLIDDDEINNYLVHRVLKQSQLFNKISFALSMKTALQKLEEFQPDIILLDVNLGPDTGFEFIEECRKAKLKGRLEHAKLFILSTSNFSSDIRKASSYDEVDGYLVKPLTLEVIETQLA